MTNSTRKPSHAPATTGRLARFALGMIPALLLLLDAGQAFSTPPAVHGVGTVGTCTFTGSIHFSPGMSMGGTHEGVVARVRGRLSNCVDGTGDGASVRGGKLKGAILSAMPLNDCMALFSNSMGQMDMHIRWRVAAGTPRLAPSVVHVGGGYFHMDGAGGAAEMMMMGHGGTEGSFFSNVLMMLNTTDQTMPELIDKCSAGPHGLKSLRFTGLHAASTLSF